MFMEMTSIPLRLQKTSTLQYLVSKIHRQCSWLIMQRHYKREGVAKSHRSERFFHIRAHLVRYVLMPTSERQFSTRRPVIADRIRREHSLGSDRKVLVQHLTLSAGYLMYKSSAPDRHVRPPRGPYADPNPCPPYIHRPTLENRLINPSPPPRSTPPRPSPDTHDHQVDNSPSHHSSPVSRATMSPNGASGPVSHHCCEESETCCCSARRSARRSCSGGRGR